MKAKGAAGNGAAELERFQRKALRYAVTCLAAVLGSGVILALVQANVQEWAKANSQDQYLVKYAGPIVDRLIELTQSSAFFRYSVGRHWCGRDTLD